MACTTGKLWRGTCIGSEIRFQIASIDRHDLVWMGRVVTDNAHNCLSLRIGLKHFAQRIEVGARAQRTCRLKQKHIAVFDTGIEDQMVHGVDGGREICGQMWRSRTRWDPVMQLGKLIDLRVICRHQELDPPNPTRAQGE